MKKNKKKTPLIALAILLMVGVVGGTIAYFTSNASFVNKFKTGRYETELTEQFTSPEAWTPGTETEKLVTIKNIGEVPVVARVSYEESWETKDGLSPSLTIDYNGSTERTVLINGIDSTKWEEKEENGKKYYYYNEVIQPGSAEIKFMDSVTFNEHVDSGMEEYTIYTYADVDGTNEITITVNKGEEMTPEEKASIENKVMKKQVKKTRSAETGYAGATYNLTINIETVQYDGYKKVWNTTKEIA